MRRLGACLAGLLLVLVSLIGCGDSSATKTIEVFAASSLTEVMAELGTRYQQTHRGTRVRASFGGSQDLVARLEDGKSADVLVTADVPTMEQAARLVGTHRIIAHNSMTIAVAPGNPKHIRGLADLTDSRLSVVLGSPTTPSGRYAVRVFTKAGVTVVPKWEEISVRSVLARVRTGEADAGIVYITDLKSAGAAASSVPIPAAQNVTADYPAAVLDRSGHKDQARTFVAWLTSPEAVGILTKYGFSPP
ncbi:molybdate ABC transporter substrate-binding protein [Actinomadura scrupuli]|uniref:molybdate ABC transporter substrate-binding protein n=1 Tax=Actinomadura scrupuli TaxID=559629 RepID=UPI003D953B9F